MLDAIFVVDPIRRQHAYDAHWRTVTQLATMDSGDGDAYSIVFTPAGVFVRGFSHLSPMNLYYDKRLWPGVADKVPAVFAGLVSEPAFSIDGDGQLAATACLWRQAGDRRWRTGTVVFPPPGHGDDGADAVFAILVDPRPQTYQRWAEDAYGVPVDLVSVQRVYRLEPLTEALVTRLNPNRSCADLAADVKQIGYPGSW